MSNIQLIKLVSGESIICQVVPESNNDDCRLLISFPMLILEIATDLQENESAYLMAPWIPFAADQNLQLNKIAVILQTAVHAAIEQEYLERVDDFLGVSLQKEVPTTTLKMRRMCTHLWMNVVENRPDCGAEDEQSEKHKQDFDENEQQNELDQNAKTSCEIDGSVGAKKKNKDKH